MRRVLTPHLHTGDLIGRDVYTRPDAPPLLRVGIRITDAYRQALERAGITWVWVDDDLSRGIEPLEALQEETKERALAAIRGAFDEAQIGHGVGVALTGPTLQNMTDVAMLIAHDIADNVHSALAL